jgi:hypothetical protein
LPPRKLRKLTAPRKSGTRLASNILLDIEVFADEAKVSGADHE